MERDCRSSPWRPKAGALGEGGSAKARPDEGPERGERCRRPGERYARGRRRTAPSKTRASLQHPPHPQRKHSESKVVDGVRVFRVRDGSYVLFVNAGTLDLWRRERLRRSCMAAEATRAWFPVSAAR